MISFEKMTVYDLMKIKYKSILYT